MNKIITSLLALILLSLSANAQEKLISSEAIAILDEGTNKSLQDILNKKKRSENLDSLFFMFLKSNSGKLHFKDVQTEKDCNLLNNFLKGVESKRDVILVRDFRDMNQNSGKALIVINKGRNGYFSRYLVGNRDILLLEIITKNQADLINDGTSSLSEVSVKYKTSFADQSIKDGLSLIGEVSASHEEKPENALLLRAINPKKIKAPLELIDTIKSKQKDDALGGRIQLHDLNIITFQIGVSNTQYNLNNFKISNGNLIVTPDSAQAKNWKSNLFAAFEIHYPRDVDNFQPLWKTMFHFKKSPYEYMTRDGYGFRNWLYNMTLDRIGLFAGVNISSDPLSGLHAGFNYAITKDLYFILGWTWNNDIAPQVTSIGNINSLGDAIKYAKRSYSSAQLSLGLSFSPSSAITMLGLDKKKGK